MGIMRTLRSLTVLAMVVGAGLAVWHRREALKRAWDRVGGVEGIKDSAGKLKKSVGPVKDLVSQVSHMK